ncbi:HD domain-containing protein [Glycomyces tritici]|uniref:HD domain-containing protein n=1 Tax=Glycomyces tritici TaxID=2665176 RepID=A0ABT7YYI3_9ACTN|nr:HD domain-containing protein [Glycomyces tritici]MDN3241817.1 HD domain-containing protein [Glycomyces tritici]MDN3243714.1 HD domain-containing protein [Glycomyces tritici]
MTTYDEAFETSRAALQEALPRRWAHVQAVGAKALAVGPKILSEPDADALAIAAILHDIGYAPSIVDTGFHPLDGARWLQRHGWDARIVNLVANHSCACLEADERDLRAELGEFPNEKTLITDALLYCDMTTGPDGQDFEIEERLAEIKSRYGPEHLVFRFISRAEPSLIDGVRTVQRELGHQPM